MESSSSPFRPDILRGKVALLTRGGSDIGFEISTQFGKHGASITIVGRCSSIVKSAVAALQSLGIPGFEISTQFDKVLQAVDVAVRVLKEGAMDSIKLQGGAPSKITAAKAIVESGIDVIALRWRLSALLSGLQADISEGLV